MFLTWLFGSTRSHQESTSPHTSRFVSPSKQTALLSVIFSCYHLSLKINNISCRFMEMKFSSSSLWYKKKFMVEYWCDFKLQKMSKRFPAELHWLMVILWFQVHSRDDHVQPGYSGDSQAQWAADQRPRLYDCTAVNRELCHYRHHPSVQQRPLAADTASGQSWGAHHYQSVHKLVCFFSWFLGYSLVTSYTMFP